MNILMVYPEFPDTFWSFKHAIKFINKKASCPPLGLATVAALLPDQWEIKLIDMNITQLIDGDILWADFVFISAMAVQQLSADSTIRRIKTLGKLVVAGGPLFTEEYSIFSLVDHFVLNEAEITIKDFLFDLQNGNLKKVYQTSSFCDLAASPPPRWDIIEMNNYDSMSIQFSRGCPFNCDFCNITALLGHKLRTKSADQIITELDNLYDLGWRRNIFFVDDNFIGNKKILKTEILPALIDWRKGKKGCQYITEASINLADDPELMQLMVSAGFVSVFVGIETPDDVCLTECNKTQNRNRDLLKSVKILQENGLQVMGGFIVGFDSDTPSIFQKQINFIQNSSIVTAMVGLLQAPYGTQLYDRMKSEGRLMSSMSGDNADGSTNIIPKMDKKQLINGYHYIIDQIYSPPLFYKRVKEFLTSYRLPEHSTHISKDEILALFRSVFSMGFSKKFQKYYWDLFFWTLFRYPKKFAMAITLSIYGYHFDKINNYKAEL